MTCAADYRIMAREPGRIGIPELLVGVPFPVVPLEILRFAAPRQYLQALAYRGLTLTAELALQHGLVDAVVESEQLLDEAVSVAASLAAIPAAAFSLTKMQMRAPTRRRIRAGAAMDVAVQDAWASPETMNAIPVSHSQKLLCVSRRPLTTTVTRDGAAGSVTSQTSCAEPPKLRSR